MSKRSSTKAPSLERRRIFDARLPYLPGLDGLRALAVIGVLLYHADLTWMPGGFLGVEAFFVISGYLITSLLLAEWRQQGRVDLKNFWLRRARRLLPALFLLLAATLTFAVVFLPDEVAGLRNDALAALAYVTNWYLVFHHQSYFETVGRPPLLQHLWSLAVEEQFYLLWPLLFIAGMRHLKRRRMLLAVLVCAAASTALMVLFYQPNVDPSRLYYGTDTRAAGFLIGAALAFVRAPPRPGIQKQSFKGWPQVWANTLLLDMIGLGALAALAWFYLQVDGYQPFLYQGGFSLVAFITAAAIAVAVDPRARLVSRLLSWGPLRWIGMRSYGIYLWHWPVFMVTRPQLDVRLEGLPLLALRLAVTFVLAELSYRYAETPIRNGALARAWQAWREARGERHQWLGLRWVGAAVAFVLLFVVLGESVVNAQPPAPPAYLSLQAIDTIRSVDPSKSVEVTPDPAASTTQPTSPVSTSLPQPLVTPTTTSPMEAAAPSSIESRLNERRSSPTPQATPQESDPTVLKPTRKSSARADRVTAIGDSVMLGAVPELEQAIPNIEINAAVGRQVSAAIDLLRTRRAAGQIGNVVIIHLGDNGTFAAPQFDELMQVLAGIKRVVFVNDKVPRPWESSNNTVLTNGVKRYPNAVLVDWHTASANQPELFWSDGIHLRPEGAKFYAELIAAPIQDH